MVFSYAKLSLEKVSVKVVRTFIVTDAHPFKPRVCKDGIVSIVDGTTSNSGLLSRTRDSRRHSLFRSERRQ